ncbi:MAG: SDR family NAD(P)-dependent oxidoreductase [Chitinophagaceae bacterium]
MKRAIVTGASSGMGRGLALLLAKAGFRVAITGRRRELLDTLAVQYPEAFIVASFDVTEMQDLYVRLDDLVQQLGGLDLFFLSAGGGDLNEDLNQETDQAMINLNITAFTAQVSWAFNLFRKQGHGHLAAISSIAGLRGLRQSPGYHACKAYQINYLQGLQQRVAHDVLNLTVTDIRPGFVENPGAKGKGRFWEAPVEKASLQIFNAVKAKKKIVYITKRWWLIGKLIPHVPGFIWRKL